MTQLHTNSETEKGNCTYFYQAFIAGAEAIRELAVIEHRSCHRNIEGLGPPEAVGDECANGECYGCDL
jgi:hypothetical protein